MNAQMQSASEFLGLLSTGSGVSGYEYSIASLVLEKFKMITDEVHCDTFGNVYALKKGNSQRAKIMLAAHIRSNSFVPGRGPLRSPFDPHAICPQSSRNA